MAAPPSPPPHARSKPHPPLQALESFVYLRAVRSPTAYDVTILLYGALLSCLWLWSLLSGVLHARKASRVRTIYAQALQLSDMDISTCEWAVVMQRLQQPQVREGLNKMGLRLPSPPSAPLHAPQGGGSIQLRLEQYTAMRLMRRDTFLVAVVGIGALQLTYPCTPCRCLRRQRGGGVSHLTLSSSSLLATPAHASPSYGAVPAPGQGGGYRPLEGVPSPPDDDDDDDGPLAFDVTFPVTSSLEWNLRASLLEPMLGGKHGRVRRRFMADGGAWRSNLRWIAAVNLLMLPVTVPCSVVYFAIRHAEEWHAKKDVLGPRSWSHTAKWAFREYNELPHLFTRRLHAGLPYASSYIKQFPAPRMATLGKGVAFIAGTVVLALVLLTLVDDQLLLNVTLGDRNLLWYLAMASAVLAAARGLVPAPEDSVVHPDSAMQLLVRYTHHYPDTWHGRAGAYGVRDAFMALFPYRLSILLAETASIVTAPFVLWCVLPRCAGDVAEFLRNNTTHIPGAGDFCTQSLFHMQPQVQGAESEVGRKQQESAPARRRGAVGGTAPQAGGAPATAGPDSRARWRAAQLKMHRSVLSFHAAYPAWSGAVTGGGGSKPPPLAGSVLESLWQQQQQGAREHGMGVSGIGLQVAQGGQGGGAASDLLASVLTVAQGGQLPAATPSHSQVHPPAQSEAWGGVAGGSIAAGVAVSMTALQRSVLLQDMYTSMQLRGGAGDAQLPSVARLPASTHDSEDGSDVSDVELGTAAAGPPPASPDEGPSAPTRYSPPPQAPTRYSVSPAVLQDGAQQPQMGKGRSSPGGVVSYDPPVSAASGGGLAAVPTPLREHQGGALAGHAPPAVHTARAHMYDRAAQEALRQGLAPAGGGLGGASGGVGLLRYMLPAAGGDSDSE